MKYPLSAFLIALGLSSSLLAQDTAPTTPVETETTKTDEVSPSVKMWQNFSNLPKESRQEFSKKLAKAQSLLNQQRIFDALEESDALDKIFKDHPATLNLRGACYVELRAFKKATALFEKVLKLAPENTSTLFNIAEIEFVTHQWASAHKLFSELVTKLPKTQKPLLRLCEFKILLCNLKLDKEAEAKALMNKYDIWDDSPYYYYSRAAFAYHTDDKREAEKMLASARVVFQNEKLLHPWQDTLVEFGYIRSFFGEEENKDDE